MKNKPIEIVDGCALVPVGGSKAIIRLDEYQRLINSGVSNNWFLCNGYVAVKTNKKIKYIHRLINESNEKTVWFRTLNHLDLRPENMEICENVGIRQKMAKVAKTGAKRQHNYVLSNWSEKERARIAAHRTGTQERQKARTKAYLNGTAQREGEKKKPIRHFLEHAPKWLLNAIPGMKDR